MPKIVPVSDLRNYNEVLSQCVKNSPVYLTKNGRGRYVVMEIEEYERLEGQLKLMAALAEGEASVKSDEDWLTLDQAFEGLEG